MSKKGGLGEGGTRGMKGKIANANRAFRFAYANFRLPSFFSRFFYLSQNNDRDWGQDVIRIGVFLLHVLFSLFS